MAKRRRRVPWFLLLLLSVVMIAVLVGTLHVVKQQRAIAGLPGDITYFQSHPTDQFLVDMDVVQSGHPYTGQRAFVPHTGAHVQFGTDYQTWPRGGTAPSDYPPIYAVADGTITGIDDAFHVDPND